MVDGHCWLYLHVYEQCSFILCCTIEGEVWYLLVLTCWGIWTELVPGLMVLRQQVAIQGRPYVLTQKSCLLTQNMDLLSHKKVLRSERKGGSRRCSVRAAMLGSPLQSTAALTQEGLAQMIMPPSILGESETEFSKTAPVPLTSCRDRGDFRWVWDYRLLRLKFIGTRTLWGWNFPGGYTIKGLLVQWIC